MLVRPFVPQMTKAEIHQIMTCGFATISGSVLVGYIGLGLNAEVLVSSCIMSIPASLAISKLRYPETEESLTAGRTVVPESQEKHENALHAFADGAMLGLRIAGSIVAALLCIIALVGLINGFLTWVGGYLNINGPLLTLQTILGYAFYPVSFLLGVSRQGNDILLVSRLIAEKVITVSTCINIPEIHLIGRTSTTPSPPSRPARNTPVSPPGPSSSRPTRAAVSATSGPSVSRSVSSVNSPPAEAVISPAWHSRHSLRVSLPPSRRPLSLAWSLPPSRPTLSLRRRNCGWGKWAGPGRKGRRKVFGGRGEELGRSFWGVGIVHLCW